MAPVGKFSTLIPTNIYHVLHQVPKGILDQIDRARKHCVWRKLEVSGKTKSVVTWRKVVKPKRKGGLGVVDLEAQNETLLLKYLDKFYNRKEVP